MALGLFSENMLGQYLMAGIKRGGGGGAGGPAMGMAGGEPGDARMEGDDGGAKKPEETDQAKQTVQGSPGAGESSWMSGGGRAVRPTETGGFDAGYAQNLATFAGQNLARPGGNLMLNPFSKTEEGFFPGGEPQTMNASALQQANFPDLSSWGSAPPPQTSSPSTPNPFQRFQNNTWMRGPLQRAGLLGGRL